MSSSRSRSRARHQQRQNRQGARPGGPTHATRASRRGDRIGAATTCLSRRAALLTIEQLPASRPLPSTRGVRLLATRAIPGILHAEAAGAGRRRQHTLLTRAERAGRGAIPPLVFDTPRPVNLTSRLTSINRTDREQAEHNQHGAVHGEAFQNQAHRPPVFHDYPTPNTSPSQSPAGPENFQRQSFPKTNFPLAGMSGLKRRWRLSLGRLAFFGGPRL